MHCIACISYFIQDTHLKLPRLYHSVTDCFIRRTQGKESMWQKNATRCVNVMECSLNRLFISSAPLASVSVPSDRPGTEAEPQFAGYADISERVIPKAHTTTSHYEGGKG